MVRSTFASFHYERDHWRVQQVLKMGAIEGQKILSPQKWEEVKRGGEQAIKNWIEKEMKYKSAVVVLIGARTASRSWVQYEITKAWKDKRPLVGIRIHGLKNSDGYTNTSGANPFEKVTLSTGGSVADYVTVHTPSGSDSIQVYNNIKNNIESWVANAYKPS